MPGHSARANLCLKVLLELQGKDKAARTTSGRISSERRISGETQAAGCLCQTLFQNCTFLNRYNLKQRYERRTVLA